MTNNALRQLHDKATHGEVLTAEEETKLAAWYARLDGEENALLTPSSKPSAIDALRDEVKKTLIRLEVTAQRIRALAEENEALHPNVAFLIGFAI